jgi:poly [ADP-ribose] polymerase
LEDSTVITEWGRVGKGSQKKVFHGKDIRFLERKKAEKEKKGYSELLTVDQSTDEISSVQDDLKSVARDQIKIHNPILQNLVDNLVEWNIHKITRNTQITYDHSTGLFSTPLGIVTREAITRARYLLWDIKLLYADDPRDHSAINKLCNQYFRLIPQDVGMRFHIDDFFGTAESIAKQNDILSSLEISFDALTVGSNTPNADNQKDDKPKPEAERVFNVDIDVVDEATFDRVSKKYVETRKDAHVCSHLKVHQVYKIDIGSMSKSFDETAEKIGNVRELWHGTKKANLLSILKSGLQITPPSTANVTGAMFGDGLYFASDSTKSLNYSYGYWDGKKEDQCFMFLADVALGRQYVPRSSSESLPVRGYDSTWAKADESGVRNDEFIIHHVNQCNLTHLIEFDR